MYICVFDVFQHKANAQESRKGSVRHVIIYIIIIIIIIIINNSVWLHDSLDFDAYQRFRLSGVLYFLNFFSYPRFYEGLKNNNN